MPPALVSANGLDHVFVARNKGRFEEANPDFAWASGDALDGVEASDDVSV